MNRAPARLHDLPKVLVPFNAAESCTLPEAAIIAGRNAETVRRWASLHDLGRIIGGQWLVSRVALACYLNGDQQTLACYLAGARGDDLDVAGYYERLSIPIPERWTA
jgi:hypothetical protein